MDQNLNYSVRELRAIQYVPTLMRFHNKGRATSAFLHILEGSYTYRTAEGRKEARRGDTVYLPIFSEYSYEILSGDALCIYVEFILETEEDGRKRIEPICKAPTVLSNASDKPTLQPLFYEILAHFHTERFFALGNLYRLISLLLREIAPPDRAHLGRIAPAVDYIRKNYTERIPSAHLAALCGISEGHLRRLFAEKLRTTPVGYKNALAAEAACTLLRVDGMRVCEVAAALGYPDIYTFSQAFKKAIGVSPKKYADGK
jgi:AraC-like DNA-binding protein